MAKDINCIIQVDKSFSDHNHTFNDKFSEVSKNINYQSSLWDSKTLEYSSLQPLKEKTNSSTPVIETKSLSLSNPSISEINFTNSISDNSLNLNSETSFFAEVTPSQSGDSQVIESDDINKPQEFQEKTQQKTKKIPKAGNIYIALSPISWHLDDIESDVNDFPFGVGMAYDFGVLGKEDGNGFFDGVIMGVEFSIFKDSDFGYPSTFVAANFRKNILNQLQIGIGAGLIYTTQLQSIAGSPVIPFVIPYIQTDFDFPVNLRIIYIPPISDWKSQQIFLTTFIRVK
jgi:hypothetical protein